MTTEALRRVLFPASTRSPVVMVVLVTALVSGLLAMHILISSTGPHAATHLANSMTVVGEPSPAVPTPPFETHAAVTHATVAHATVAHDPVTRAVATHNSITYASFAAKAEAEADADSPPSHGSSMTFEAPSSTKCSDGCMPVHAMGATGCVLTLSSPVLLFAAAHPAPTPAPSIDRFPGFGLVRATQSLRVPEPPDLYVLSVSRT